MLFYPLLCLSTLKIIYIYIYIVDYLFIYLFINREFQQERLMNWRVARFVERFAWSCFRVSIVPSLSERSFFLFPSTLMYRGDVLNASRLYSFFTKFEVYFFFVLDMTPPVDFSHLNLFPLFIFVFHFLLRQTILKYLYSCYSRSWQYLISSDFFLLKGSCSVSIAFTLANVIDKHL